MPRTCPDDARLQQLLLGLLPADEAAPLEEHLDACPHCAARAEGASGADELIGAMRAGAGAAKADERARVVQLAERLVRFRSEARAAEVSTLAGEASSHSAAARTLDLPPEIAEVLGPPQSADELGRLGPYRILDVLGVGGMGVVFRAEEMSQSRPAALKVIHPRLADHPEARPRFLREARALAAVSDPHIVPLLAAGEAGGLLYLEMPLLHGETLEQRLARDGKLPAAEVVRIGREVAAGLAAAHAAGLIHRDLKPANVWLEGPGGRVKLLDFGLVHVEAEVEERLTVSGVLLGTPGYMSPEQAKGERVDFRADLFSLGCVLYKACTGQRPFRGGNVQEELTAVVNHQPASPHTVERTVSRDLSDLIVRLLSKKPQQRGQSAADIKQLLAGFLHAENHPQELGVSLIRRPRRWLLGAGVFTGVALALAAWTFPLSPDSEGRRTSPRADENIASPSARFEWMAVDPIGQVFALNASERQAYLWNGKAFALLRKEVDRLAVDTVGQLLVLDAVNRQVFRREGDKFVLTNGRFEQMVVDPVGQVFALNATERQAYLWSGVAFGSFRNEVDHLAVDTAGQLLVHDAVSRQVFRRDGDKFIEINGRFEQMVVDPIGQVFVLKATERQVYLWNTVAVTPLRSEVDRLAVDTFGQLHVLDSVNRQTFRREGNQFIATDGHVEQKSVFPQER